jgi:hypothetical protein
MKLPRVVLSVALLVGSSVGVFVYTSWLLFKTSILPLDYAWLSKNVGNNIVYVVLIALDGVSIYLLMSGGGSAKSLDIFSNMRNRGYKIPFNEAPPEQAAPIYTEPMPEASKPSVPETVTLEALMGTAMRRGLNADLKFTLKLPENTKLDILGQKWDVSDAMITLNNAKKEEKPLVLEGGASDEEKRYFQRVPKIG